MKRVLWIPWLLLACSEPTGPTSLGRLAAIVTGYDYDNHTCAITTTGEAYCWGMNFYGQLGNGSNTTEIKPVPGAVLGNIAFSSIGVGHSFSCGLSTDGTARCWGDNHWGYLGKGTLRGADSVPVRVTGDLTFTTLSVGWGHTCGLTRDGSAYCWGEIYLPPDTATPLPVPLAGNLRFTAISVGMGEACAISIDALTYCWTVIDSLPVLVPNAEALVSISVGAYFACGLDASGAAYCWGQNGFGQLGRGYFSGHGDEPQLVSGALRFASIDAGTNHTCAVTLRSVAYCWGKNWSFELGDPQHGAWSTPREVSGHVKFASISAGDGYSCGIAVDGAGYCWGNNDYGQLGADQGPPPPYSPQRITGF